MALVFLVAFVATIVGMLAVLPALRLFKVIDVPNARSSHSEPIPRGGGLASTLGMGSGVMFAFAQGVDVPWWFLVIIVVMAGIGFIDDMASVSVRSRLMIQAGIGTVVAISASDLVELPDVIVGIMAVVWLVGFTNAFNFMDGVNGISGTNAAAAGSWYAFVGWHLDFLPLQACGLVVAASALGFLPWNAPRARVFLGDTGSYSWGMAIAALALLTVSYGGSLLIAFAPLIIYSADTGWTLFLRAARREPLHIAHRSHVYQQIADSIGHVATALVTVAFSGACMAVVGFSLSQPMAVTALYVVGIACVYLASPGWIPRIFRRRRTVGV